MACNPSELLAAASCLTCLDPMLADLAETSLICRLADQGLPSGYPVNLLGEGEEFLLGEGGENILEQ